MSAVMLTPETAPRDLAELEKIGHFVHRRLFDELHGRGVAMWREDAEKAAFLSAQPKARAEMLLDGLQRFDAMNGGAPKQPAVQRQPAPAQTAPAAQAAAPGGGGAMMTQGATQPAIQRQPRPNGNGVAGHASPAPNGAPAAQGRPGPSPELQQLLATVQAIAEAQSALQSQVAELSNKLDGVLDTVDGVHQAANAQAALGQTLVQVQKVQIGLLALFGEQVLQAPMSAFVSDVPSYSDKALELIEQLTGAEGKAG